MLKAKEKTVIYQLLVESQENPLGIDVKKPRFSWKISSKRKGVYQTAYQIVVKVLDSFSNSVMHWDSGRVTTDQSAYVPYIGPELVSRIRYEWKVRIWDEQGTESEWSTMAFWEMGLLHPSDWSAQWIEPMQNLVTGEAPFDYMNMHENKVELPITERLHPCPILRRSFDANGQIQRARVYVTAHGIYHLELNGSKIGNFELAPEYTSYPDYLQYQTYDVTSLLKEGNNAIGVILSDGWYAGRISFSGESCQYGNKLGLLLQLEIDYVDGSKQLMVSDGRFKSSYGSVRYSDLFIGEMVDARLEQAGWSEVDFEDSHWNEVEIVNYGFENIVAHYGEPVRVIDEIQIDRILMTPKGEVVLDFGQVIAGRVRMHVNGQSGTEIVLEHSEVLNEDGNFTNNILGRNKEQKDIYILRGGTLETFEPKFTYHGFRFIKVSGFPGIVRKENFTGIILSSDLRTSGEFTCSDHRLDRLQQNIVWSQKANMLSIPTDCPQREKAGWTGDIQVYAPTAAFNMDMNAFLTRWLRNVVIEQFPDGQVPNVVPAPSAYLKETAAAGLESSAGWGDAIVIVPWVLYQVYGDTRILEDNYEAMVKWVSYIEKTAAEQIPNEIAGRQLTDEERERQKYLWNTGQHFGDWNIPSFDQGDGPDLMQNMKMTKDWVATSFFAHSTKLLSNIASVIGHETDALRYNNLNIKIRKAFSEEYLNGDGTLKTHFQGMCVLALHMNMIPDSVHSKVLDQLVQLIENNGNRLDTGFVSTPFLLDVLYNNGRSDVAYQLLYQTEAPSWLYEVEKGATTIWESWKAIRPDGKITDVSYNHYAFGCVGDWLYRRIAGIDKTQAGYKHIIIHPDLKCSLTYAKASYDSIYGTIVSEWSINAQKVEVYIEIPANTTATLVLTGVRKRDIELEDGIRLITESEAGVTVEVGSGEYSFAYEMIS
ncbi:glycoside hydrolase family 78 protein [Paenibacillus luteus]|uniref:glycoside hydrolase family 78 protein n=1 Tax=Paenibacillus luteus TaxID=2545753 RepID=UPI001141A3F4|nr:glycoside hydrolase family 78 protein [Paenibacillus luteus]